MDIESNVFITANTLSDLNNQYSIAVTPMNLSKGGTLTQEEIRKAYKKIRDDYDQRELQIHIAEVNSWRTTAVLA